MCVCVCVCVCTCVCVQDRESIFNTSMCWWMWERMWQSTYLQCSTKQHITSNIITVCIYVLTFSKSPFVFSYNSVMRKTKQKHTIEKSNEHKNGTCLADSPPFPFIFLISDSDSLFTKFKNKISFDTPPCMHIFIPLILASHSERKKMTNDVTLKHTEQSDQTY